MVYTQFTLFNLLNKGVCCDKKQYSYDPLSTISNQETFIQNTLELSF